MIMEDLSCWKSASPSNPISKVQMVSCLKNVSILHAKFWGLKNVDSLNIGISKVEQDTRQAAHQKMAKTVLKKLVKSPNLFRKVQNSMLKCKLLNTWFQKFHILNSEFFNQIILIENKIKKTEARLTGKSFSEALILVSTNPQYDKRLSIELPVHYMKTTSSEHQENMLCT